MATQNSSNNKFTNNADGFDLAGGTTERKLTLSGADVAVVGSGTAVVTFPSSTSTLATLALAETLTNKTLTSPKINEDVAVTATATELNYVDGVTSAIQTQFTGKAATTLANLGSVAINTTLVSDTDNTDALGTAAIGWSDLFLGSGAVITFSTAPSTADITLTHSADTLTFAGGTLALGTSNLTMTGSIAATGARVTKVWTADLESTNMPTVGGTAILTSLTAPQFTTIELGHASDTTLSRSAAGVIAVEGIVIPSISSTNTFTNKRNTKRTGTTTSSATPTINTDNVDEYYITEQAEAITSFTTNLSGTPTLGQLLFISVIGTAARGITWGASFANGPVALPTTTVTTTQLSTLLKWDGSIWRCYATGSTV